MIRNIEMKDAAAFLAMQLKLDTETKNMLYEPGERPAEVENTQRIIRNHIDTGSLLLVAEEDGEIVGFLSANKGNKKRVAHTAYIVVGILSAYQGQGIASAFFKELDRWAKDQAISRLELIVMVTNERAIRLYQKNGFVIEGTKKNSVRVDGRFIDEYYMAKLL